MVVGKRIRERRLELGLSQEKLAERAQLHRTYIYQVESGGHNVALLNLVRIARALQLTPAQLLEGVT